jgi:hypothetical protein
MVTDWNNYRSIRPKFFGTGTEKSNPTRMGYKKLPQTAHYFISQFFFLPQ